MSTQAEIDAYRTRLWPAVAKPIAPVFSTLTSGDTITLEGVSRWPWLVRAAAWICRVHLLQRPTPLRQFVVTSLTSATQFGEPEGQAQREHSYTVNVESSDDSACC